MCDRALKGTKIANASVHREVKCAVTRNILKSVGGRGLGVDLIHENERADRKGAKDYSSMSSKEL